MATTAEKLREMRRKAGKNHDAIIRGYYDETNAQKLGHPLPYAISGDVYFVRDNGRAEKLDLEQLAREATETNHKAWRACSDTRIWISICNCQG